MNDHIMANAKAVLVGDNQPRLRFKRASTRFVALIAVAWIALFHSSGDASAQITPARNLGASQNRIATLKEQLVNRLRATLPEQRAYLKDVVSKVNQGRLELRLILAIERYALKKNPRFGFPFFERALRYEAGRRGISMLPVELFRSTAKPGTISTFVPAVTP